MENNNKKKSLIIIIVISLLFGVTGGIGGEIFARVYLLQDVYKVPLFGEINVPQNVYGGSNLTIESPKKVVVEQNTKVLETVNSARKNIVGIFKKIKDTPEEVATTTTFNLDNRYDLSNPKGQGFVVTSDGWIMSDYVPNNLLLIDETQASSSLEKAKNNFISGYVVITSDGKIYDLVDVRVNANKSISFWQINASDLGVRQFESISNIAKGQLVVATNFEGMTWLTTVSSKYPQNLPPVLSSDVNYSEINLVNNLPADFGSGFLFNIDGNLIALLQAKEKIIPVSSYFSCLSCLLSQKTIARPYLGINYINLNNFSNPDTSKIMGQGAMIYKNANGVAVIKDSPAEVAGLKEGDIITAINTIKIDSNNTLSDLISGFKPGEKLNFTIERGSIELQLIVTLAELK